MYLRKLETRSRLNQVSSRWTSASYQRTIKSQAVGTGQEAQTVSYQQEVASRPFLQGGRQTIQSKFQVSGEGPPLVILPTINTVSTRQEMYGIFEHFSKSYSTYLLDWPGFGEESRQALAYEPKVLLTFLETFLSRKFSGPVSVITAGHGMGYVIKAASADPARFSKIACIAPTFLGPFAIMGMPEQARSLFRETLWSPYLGASLYGRMTTPSSIKKQLSSHVYTQPSFIGDGLLEQKVDLIKQPNARYGPAAFITGSLDVYSKEDLAADLKALAVPTLFVVGEDMPKRSKAAAEEMGQYAAKVVRVAGCLGMAEEYPKPVIEEVERFFSA